MQCLPRRTPLLGFAIASLLAGGSLHAATVVLNPANATGTAAAINAAIAAAKAGDTVTLPAGTYQLDGPVNLKSGVNLTGAGQSGQVSTILKSDSTALNPMMGGDSLSNVALTGFTLDGNNNANASQGILLSNSSSLNVHGLTVTNLAATADTAGPHGIYCSTSVTNSTISGNTFTNIGLTAAYGAGIRLAYGSSNNKVLNNTITNTGRGGILCNNGSTDNSICNNTVTGSGGVGLGIEVQGCARSLIQNNTIDHWLSVDDSSGSAIRGNTISDKSGTYKLCGLELVDSSNVSFTHNTVDGGAQVGISISGPNPKSQLYFGHNTINAASTWGTQIQGDSQAGSVSEGYFYSNTFSDALSISVAQGALYAKQGYGVRFNGNTHFVTFDKNQVTANQGEGMQVGGGNVDNLTFTNNTITNNNGVAIEQDPAVTATQWSANTVSGNTQGNTIPASSAQPARSVSINAPTLISPGQSANFSATLAEPSVPGAVIVNALWDFGDGLPATTAAASHTFALPGTYEVVVVVWDGTGYGAQSETSVTVTPEPGMGAIVGCLGILLARRPRRRACREPENKVQS